MGIPKAAQLLKRLYGPADARVWIPGAGGDTVWDSSTTTNSDSERGLNLLDLPTYYMVCLVVTATKIASSIFNNRSSARQLDIGQMIVFCDKASNVVRHILYDENNFIQQDDILVSKKGVSADIERASNFKTSMTTPSGANIASEFFALVRKKSTFDPDLHDVRLIPVNIPGSLVELEDFTRRHDNETIMPDTSIRTFDGAKEWLLKHQDINEGVFFDFEHLFNGVFSEERSAVNKYENALAVSKYEGLILYLSWCMIVKLENLLHSGGAGKRRFSRKSHAVFFSDGHPSAAIKQLARYKRKKKRNSTPPDYLLSPEDDTALITSACERALMKIPQSVYQTALFDVLRIPLANTLNLDRLFVSSSLLSEAEDDIVRVTSLLAGLNTPVSHFREVSESRVITECWHKDLVPTDSAKRAVRNRSTVKWSDFVNILRDEQRLLNIRLFSHDSDVIIKWNLIVGHHELLTKFYNGNAAMTPPTRGVEELINSIVFVRSITLRGKRTSCGDDHTTSLNNNDDNNRLTKRETLYDLTQSPVLQAPESTMLLMLLNGSDYNDPLVSPDTVSEFGTRIREEIALFSHYSCTCMGGWQVLRNMASKDRYRYYSDGTVHGLSPEACGMCNKKLVVPFWEIKVMLASQVAERFFDNPRNMPIVSKKSFCSKWDMNMALAVNVCSNVMAYLTMGCFNQKMFGSISSHRKNVRKTGIITDMILKKAQAHFAKYTEGSIPLDWRDTSIEKCRAGIFGLRARFIALDNKNSVEDVVVDGLTAPELEAMFAEEEELEEETVLPAIVDMQPSVKTESEIEAMSLMDILEEEFLSKSYYDGGSRALIKRPPPPPPPPSTKPRVGTASSAPPANNSLFDDLVSIDKDIRSERSKCESDHAVLAEIARVCSNKATNDKEESIMSILYKIVMTAQKKLATDGRHTPGVNDRRVISHVEKIMDLLIVIYLNVCGMQENSIASERKGQFLPVLHAEEFREEKTAATHTTRVAVISAIYELCLFMYKSELRPDSNIIHQTRRNWDTVYETVTKFNTEMQQFATNYRKFPLSVQSETIFMPLLGICRAKPWSALMLWGVISTLC